MKYKLNGYYSINDFVKLFYNNRKVLLISKRQFIPNKADILKSDYDSVIKNYNVFLLRGF